MMRPLATGLAALSLAACADRAPTKNETLAPKGGWSIEPESDLNALFDCLADNGATLVAAHRGGPATGFPENAIETFAKTLTEAPALIETDVATSADGVLYLMHDDTLDRTTTGAGAIDSLPWNSIRALHLNDDAGAETPYNPPSFADALRWADGRTILEIDFKRSTRFEDVVAEINRQQAEDRVLFIAYTTAQAALLHRLAPKVMISLNLATQSDLNRAVAAGVPADRLLGFTGLEEPSPRLNSILSGEDIEVIFGTLGGRDSIDNEIERSGDEAYYAGLAKIGVDIIATDRPVAAQAALEKAGYAAKAGACGIARDG